MAPPPVPDRTETLTPSARTPAPEACEAASRAPADAAGALPGGDDPDRYELVAEHARGGRGRVVRAVDKRLGRTVAVKELLAGSADPEVEARFLREALITARLEHPGIVPVHEAGRWWPNGDPYYVMKLVEGRTLKELLAERAHLRERLGLLPHVIAIADAVGYAHMQGVIHRDLKPSNVIVGAFGETIVVDWGLARDLTLEVPELPEPVVGTPAYMAPEQARGEPVDARVDVYAIGAVLYELLAGTTAHHDATPQGTLERVIAGPPRPLAHVAQGVPDELATIVAKAMARTPDARYANATALAEDLRRFQTGKLVSAHSYTAWSLVRKKLAQHRGVVAVGVASALALAAVGVESFRRVVAEKDIAQVERVRAIDSRSQAEKRQRELVLLQAVTSLRKDPTATVAWLKDYPIRDADRAQVQDVVDEALALGVARHVFRPGDWVLDAVFTPDGQRVVAGVRDGRVRVYDLRTGVETALDALGAKPEVLALAPDGAFALIGDALGDVTLWPLDGGAPRVVAHGGGMVSSLQLSDDARRVLVTRDKSGPAEVIALDGGAPAALGPPATLRKAVAERDWSRAVVTTSLVQVDAVEGGAVRPLATTDKAVSMLALSPSGEVALVYDGATVWTVPFAGGPLRRLAAYEGKLHPPVWSPDERTVALFGPDRHELVLVALATGAVTELRGHTDAIYTVQWTRDGRRVVSASDDATARVWTIADRTALVLRGHDDDVVDARFSVDEAEVVTASLDGSVRVWRIDRPGSRTLVEGGAIARLEVDGDRAIVTTADEVARWDLAAGRREELFAWADEPGRLGYAVASPDGERLIVFGVDWSIEVRRRGHAPLVLRGHRSPIAHVELGRDGATLFTSSLDGTLRRWDLTTGAGEIVFAGAAPIRRFAVAADGRIVAHAGDEAVLVRPGAPPRVLGQGPAWCALLSEFERVRDRLVLRRCDYSLAILDGERLVELPTDHHHVIAIAVSPDGGRIAAAMGDRTVRLWDAATGELLRTLRGHTDLVMAVAFAPDGAALASSSYDKTVRIWDLGSAQHRVLRGHGLAVDHVAWRGRSQVVTGSRDGTLRIWDVPPMALPAAAELARRLDGATSARIDVDRPTSSLPARRGT